MSHATSGSMIASLGIVLFMRQVYLYHWRCWLYFQNIDFAEGFSELCGHEKIENEVECLVDEGHQVHHLPHRIVTIMEKLFPKNRREKAENTLKELLYLAANNICH